MKRWMAAGAGAGIALMIFGCSRLAGEDKGFLPRASSIYVTKDGVISSATVEAYEGKNYSSSDLLAFISREVAEYNAVQNGQEGQEEPEVLPVAVISCQAEEGRLTVVYRYADSDAFRQFAEEYHDEANQTIAFHTDTASSGRLFGWLEDGEFVKVEKNNVRKAAQEELNKLKKERVIQVETDHPLVIQTEGKILYTTRGVALPERTTARIPQGKHYIIFK